MENKNNRVLGRILAVEELTEVTGARPPITMAYYVETNPDSDNTGSTYDSGTTADSGTTSDSGTTADSGTTSDSGTTADSGTSSDSGIFAETLARRPEAEI